MLINPATVPTYIGLTLFILGGLINIPEVLEPIFKGYIVPIIKDNVLFLLKSCVIPFSMFIIGIRLAECDRKTLFKDKYLPLYLIIRLLIIPILCMFILKGVELTGVLPYNILQPASIVLIISASTPAAAMAGILAEQFGGDAAYAGKVVSASTIVSLLTMPIIAALLLKVFP
jgi:predicted permease